MEQNKEDWREFTKMLRRHQATLANHAVKLEEDCKVGITSNLGVEIGEALDAYARSNA